MAIFDNEEIGSTSYQGCDSAFFGDTLKRVFNTVEVNDEVNVPSNNNKCN